MPGSFTLRNRGYNSSGGVNMSIGWDICGNCSKRDCGVCPLARREPERIAKIMPRVLENIEHTYIREPEKAVIE